MITFWFTSAGLSLMALMHAWQAYKDFSVTMASIVPPKSFITRQCAYKPHRFNRTVRLS